MSIFVWHPKNLTTQKAVVSTVKPNKVKGGQCDTSKWTRCVATFVFKSMNRLGSPTNANQDPNTTRWPLIIALNSRWYYMFSRKPTKSSFYFQFRERKQDTPQQLNRDRHQGKTQAGGEELSGFAFVVSKNKQQNNKSNPNESGILSILQETIYLLDSIH